MSAIRFLSMFAKITLHYITIHDDGDLENYVTITSNVARSERSYITFTKKYCNRPTLFLGIFKSVRAYGFQI